MNVSRQRKRELQRLRASADELWGAQQEVLAHAGDVAREASRQLGHFTREEVVPRVQSGYSHYVAPGVSQVGRVARTVGQQAERTAGKVLGTALSIGDIAADTRVRNAVARFAPRAAPVVEPPKKKGGFGTFLLVGGLAAAFAAFAYAVWETFRADDELWVAEDNPVD